MESSIEKDMESFGEVNLMVELKQNPGMDKLLNVKVQSAEKLVYRAASFRPYIALDIIGPGLKNFKRNQTTKSISNQWSPKFNQQFRYVRVDYSVSLSQIQLFSPLRRRNRKLFITSNLSRLLYHVKRQNYRTKFTTISRDKWARGLCSLGYSCQERKVWWYWLDNIENSFAAISWSNRQRLCQAQNAVPWWYLNLEIDLPLAKLLQFYNFFKKRTSSAIQHDNKSNYYLSVVWNNYRIHQ